MAVPGLFSTSIQGIDGTWLIVTSLRACEPTVALVAARGLEDGEQKRVMAKETADMDANVNVPDVGARPHDPPAHWGIGADVGRLVIFLTSPR